MNYDSKGKISTCHLLNSVTEMGLMRLRSELLRKHSIGASFGAYYLIACGF